MPQKAGRNVYVLVHSPSVGPGSWAAVAEEMRPQGLDVVVPSLLDVARFPPPSAPVAVRCVRAALDGVGADRPLTLVVHSNAGYFAPSIALEVGSDVDAIVFVDAGIPPSAGESALAPPELLQVLEQKAVGGVLPPWTRWWKEDEVEALFPDRATMRSFQAEEPRLPLAYYSQSLPAPAGWDDRRCSYLLFSDAYGECAREARERGWPVETVRGEHLHMLVDARSTAHAIIRLAGHEPRGETPGQ